MGTQLVRRAILVVATILSAFVIIGGIMLDRSPPKPLPCAHTLMQVDYVRPPANYRERDAREKLHYMDVGPGCP